MNLKKQVKLLSLLLISWVVIDLKLNNAAQLRPSGQIMKFLFKIINSDCLVHWIDFCEYKLSLEGLILIVESTIRFKRTAILSINRLQLWSNSPAQCASIHQGISSISCFRCLQKYDEQLSLLFKRYQLKRYSFQYCQCHAGIPFLYLVGCYGNVPQSLTSLLTRVKDSQRIIPAYIGDCRAYHYAKTLMNLIYSILNWVDHIKTVHKRFHNLFV